MKKTLKGFLIGFIAATVLTGSLSFAAQTVRIILNGNEIIPTDATGKRVDPILVDGTTYLPVRAISSALGLEVGWNEETYTVSLTKPVEEKEEEVKEEPAEEVKDEVIEETPAPEIKENVFEGIAQVIANNTDTKTSKLLDKEKNKLHTVDGEYPLGEWGNYKIIDGELEYFNMIDHYGWTRAKIEKTGISKPSFDPELQIKFTDGTVLSLWRRKVKINTQWFNTSESLEVNSLMTNFRSISNILGTSEIWYQTNEDGEITRIETID